MNTARCYRCLALILSSQALTVRAPCGCEHGYCSECVSPDLNSWLKFMADRCTKPNDQAIVLAA